MPDLTPILVPVVVSLVLSVSGAFVVARWSGPAQNAYIAALEGRLRVVSADRDESMSRIAKLEARIEALEAEVIKLQHLNTEKEREIAQLYRRLDADERRLRDDEARLP